MKSFFVWIFEIIKMLKWGLLIIGLMVLFYFIWQFQVTEEVHPGDALKDERPITLFNPVLYDYEQNKTKWRFAAEKADVFEKRKLMILDQVKGKVFSRDSKQKTTLVFADSGKIKGKSKLIHLWGNVRIILDTNRRILTEELFIDQQKETIYNEVDTLALSEHDSINASAMVYDIKTSLLILKQPRMEFTLDSKEKQL